MFLEIKDLDFSYTPEKPLFRQFNLQIQEGETVAVAGESGCGKSTLMSLIYGLIDWQNGEISFDGKRLWGPKGNIVPGESEMKFVAQNYDLMPYSTVYDNVGKFISNINLKDKREKVMQLLQIVGMEDFADVKPQFLSGGQQQRVAIARALSVKPKLLLLDEPFSNIDFSRKVELRERLFNYAKNENISLLISTHEIQEIMPWLDRIIILKNGELVQNDSPKNTYQNPNNEYVARLFGEVNIFSVEEQISFHLPKRFYYPTDIRLSENGQKVSILESRFSGNFYWNKAILGNEKIIIFYSENSISGEQNIIFK